MDVQTRLALVDREPICEIITKEELEALFEQNSQPKHYIGFEISGKVHIASGLLTSLILQDFIKAKIRPTIFLADYHAWLNGKLGGDLQKIQEVAKGYFKHAFISLGLTEDKVDYVLASEIYDKDYWKEVLSVSKETTIKRMLRCTTIMGRTQQEAMDCASILYPAMQAADIFFLQVDIAHAGTDQRKVHMLARELSKRKFVAVHHRLLMGLDGPQKMGGQKEELEISSKMSKSKPSSCIFIHDSEEEIKKKLSAAYCPAAQSEDNPVLQMCKYIIFRQEGSSLQVQRPSKFGGDVEFFSYQELEAAYLQGKLHPADLKNAVAEALCKMLAGPRKYFQEHPQLLAQLG
ncbi:MAG: tyrosine--tRNA ligase [Candidatus Micrarchaeota archaeon]|nr:tyrosine--tRNA ligase [Candidatus Micrarchaeota archaeon]